MHKKISGFTLVELMIALVISGVLLIGVTGAYSAINGTIKASKALENAQEVIRYSSQVFTRSLKQSVHIEIIEIVDEPIKITVKQKANTISCVGTIVTVDYTEIFVFEESKLSCEIKDNAGDIVKAKTTLLTGINRLIPTLDDTLFSLIVEPQGLPKNFILNDDTLGVRIDIALTHLILKQNAMSAS